MKRVDGALEKGIRSAGRAVRRHRRAVRKPTFKRQQMLIVDSLVLRVLPDFTLTAAVEGSSGITNSLFADEETEPQRS